MPSDVEAESVEMGDGDFRMATTDSSDEFSSKFLIKT
jgi:hypothetical protein